jgi:hypothetical protein
MHGVTGDSLWHELQCLDKAIIDQEKFCFKGNYVHCDKYAANINIVSKEVWVLRTDVQKCPRPTKPRLFPSVNFTS